MDPSPLPEADAAAMADLPAYAETRDSGVEWLGEVPAHWEVRRIAGLARILNGATPSSTHAPYWGGHIPWITPTDLGALAAGAAGAGRRISRTARSLTTAGYDACGASLAPPDSLALSTRAPIGHLAILGRSCCTNQGCRLLVPSNHIRSEFLYYALSTFREEMKAFGQGSTFSELSREKLAAFRIVQPPLAEQTAIARFLDYVDRRIRRYIHAKEKLIALLEEQKQAVIHQAVTGQVDVRTGRPYPAYKDSGVEWLGKVPEHWDVRRAKQLFKEADDRSATGLEELLSVSHITGVTPRRSQKTVTMFEARSTVGYKLCQPGDIVVNTMWAWMAALGVARQVGLVSPSYAIYRPLHPRKLAAEYVDFLLRTKTYRSEYRRRSTGIRSSRLRLYPDEFLRILMLCPPSEEQRAIVAFANKTSRDSQDAGALAARQRSLLQRYRERLIADVVTGKLDVREAAASLPEVGPLEENEQRCQTAFI